MAVWQPWQSLAALQPAALEAAEEPAAREPQRTPLQGVGVLIASRIFRPALQLMPIAAKLQKKGRAVPFIFLWLSHARAPPAARTDGPPSAIVKIISFDLLLFVSVHVGHGHQADHDSLWRECVVVK